MCATMIWAIWYDILSNTFQFLNNITCIFLYFLTYTYFQKIQITLLEQHYQMSVKNKKFHIYSCQLIFFLVIFIIFIIFVRMLYVTINSIKTTDFITQVPKPKKRKFKMTVVGLGS